MASILVKELKLMAARQANYTKGKTNLWTFLMWFKTLKVSTNLTKVGSELSLLKSTVASNNEDQTSTLLTNNSVISIQTFLSFI